MIEIVSLKPQKDFPLHDISEDNAEALELILSDSAIVDICHSTAERTSSLYKLSHRVLRELVPAIPGMSTRDAYHFNQGVVRYEAASSLIKLKASGEADHLDDTEAAGYVMYLLHNDDQFNYFDRAHSQLLSEQETFSEILTSIAMHVAHSDRRAVENTLFGAAVQRQIEIDAFRHNEEKFRRDVFGDTGA